ncbi:MAG: pyridine nucleotide-disulfide oxidoreductase [Clostridiales bacterium GWF2_38_85]|nr:MAG: pyridine nucleotide-disulfide oxidoreductase [Clostridiales bacterium GWF2_38_85]HBL84613.1 pyridine nucleotide-disulfide oxidoreductase [Clostridiales bacterium]
MKNIIIIGAGYSGVLIAKGLAKRFKKDPNVSITIIDKNPFHTMLTELHEVAAGRVEEESIRMSLRQIFDGRRVNVVTDTVESVHFTNKTVICNKNSYSYDYIVIAAGSKPTYFGVPGADKYAYTLWSYDDAIKLRDKITNCFRLASSESDLDKKKKLLTFYVVGAGFTGVEMVGELAEFVPISCDKYEIPRELVTICNVDFLDRVVPTLPEKLSAKVLRRLIKMGVTVKLKTKVVEIGEDFIEVEHEGEQIRRESSTIIWVAGIESSEITNKVSKEIPTSNRGRLLSDKYLRSTQDESVYIVGDNLCFTPEGEKMPVPQMVENCEQSAHTAAHNIYSTISGKGELEEYKPKFHGVMVSVGGRYGSARVGTSKHMFNLPSFLAMFTKHFINIVYFIQVLGWNKIASYIKHEFFTIRNKRSFVGGHFSNRTPSFLLVLLRMWLGAVWIFEGVMKIVEGWLKTPMLEGFFGGANSWFNSIINGTTSDAVTSATGSTGGEVVEKVETLIFNLDFLGLFKAIFVSGAELAKSTVADFAFKLDIPLMNWFIDKIILPNDWVQLAMQIFIVVSEILIGLSLLGGLFTTPSSTFSIVLLFMFTCTTGLYLSSFWMIFAAIALLFSGRVFGFDYYTTPWLKKGWKKIRWVRRSYLYHD